MVHINIFIEIKYEIENVMELRNEMREKQMGKRSVEWEERE